MGSDREHNGAREIGKMVLLLTTRGAVFLFTAATFVLGLWLKANVPTKEELKELQSGMRSLERTVDKMPNVQPSIDQLEKRVFNLEQKFPVRRTIP